MTLDEAIKHCLDIADGQDKCADISVSEHAKERIRECANDHRQLAEWLTELKEAKRLLKAAAKIVKNLPCDDDNCGEGWCHCGEWTIHPRADVCDKYKRRIEQEE